MSMRPSPWVATMYASLGGVAYVVAGYPLIAGAWALIRPRPVQRTAALPSVTLIVPCFNEVDVIADKIADIGRLDYPLDRLDIVIVDDGSTDGTADAARTAIIDAEAHVRLVTRSERAGKAVAINTAIADSAGEVVALSDATAVWDPSALRSLVRSFGDEDVGAVSGRMSYGGKGVGRVLDLYWRYEDSIRSWESLSGTTVGVNGNIFAIRRRDAELLPAGTVNDELTLSLRASIAGRRVVFDADAYASDLPSPTMKVETGRRSRMTAGRLMSTMGPARGIWKRPGLAFRFVSHKLLRPFVPVMGGSALVAAAATLLTARVRVRPVDRFVASSIVMGSASIVVMGGVGRMVERLGRPVPLVFRGAHLVTSSAMASLIGIVRALSGRQRGTWVKRPPSQTGAASAHSERR